jgi:hypothetical protein
MKVKVVSEYVIFNQVVNKLCISWGTPKSVKVSLVIVYLSVVFVAHHIWSVQQQSVMLVKTVWPLCNSQVVAVRTQVTTVLCSVKF